MKALFAVLAALIASLGPVWAAGEPDVDARAIMERNFFVTKLKSVRATSEMVLINAKGERRVRKSTNVAKLQPNGIDSKVLVKFLEPSDIRGTSFLQIEHADGEDDLWIYLPSLKKSRRLVANNKKDSFVGSDFSYGDILLPKVDLYRHTVLRSEAVDGHECHVIESVPIDEPVRRGSGYSSKHTWVRKDNFLETRVDYYDLGGRLLKTQRISGHTLVDPEGQRWFATRREMSNEQTGHRTVLTFDQVEPGVKAPDELFTTRYLERE